MKWFVIFGAVCALLMGCSDDKDAAVAPNQQATVSLSGTKWQLAAWSAGDLDTSTLMLTAEFGETEIFGRTTINNFGGTYVLGEGNAFSVIPLFTTRMAGSDEAMRAEATYLDLLTQVRQYSLKPTTLTLSGENDQELLTFKLQQ